jgi:catechol 2,3-dioxygenase-like lactoylglutathione lyase family enzyme
MIDHISLQVTSFAKAMAFYKAALAPLDLEAQYVDEAAKSAGFGPKGGPCLWIAQGKPAARIHLAIRAANREAVGAFHAASIRAGGKDNGKPGPRPEYDANYYAAFVLDPDGNNVEAVTHNPG